MDNKIPTSREIIILISVLTIVSVVALVLKLNSKINMGTEGVGVVYQNPYSTTYDIRAVFKQIPDSMPKFLVLGRGLVITDIKEEATGAGQNQVTVNFTAQNSVAELVGEYEKMLATLGWIISSKNTDTSRVSILVARQRSAATILISAAGESVKVTVIYSY